MLFFSPPKRYSLPQCYANIQCLLFPQFQKCNAAKVHVYAGVYVPYSISVLRSARRARRARGRENAVSAWPLQRSSRNCVCSSHTDLKSSIGIRIDPLEVGGSNSGGTESLIPIFNLHTSSKYLINVVFCLSVCSVSSGNLLRVDWRLVLELLQDMRWNCALSNAAVAGVRAWSIDSTGRLWRINRGDFHHICNGID
jgi:hypothetical protein